MDLALAEEYLLVSRGPDGRSLVAGVAATRGVAGALLVELALRGEVGVRDGRLVADASGGAAGRSAAHPELDALAARIRAESHPRKPKWWVQKAESRAVNTRLLAGLAGRGILAEHPRRALGLFPVTRWVEQDPQPADAVRRRLVRAVEGGPADARTAALVAVVDACGLSRRLFRDVPAATRRARIRELSEGEWAATAVRDAIRAVQAAVAAAAVAASTGG